MLPEIILYASQAVAAAIYAAVLELGLKRAYEPNYTWATVVWGVAQVGLLVAARLALVPIPGGDAQTGAWYAWWLVLWSFVWAAMPIIGWQLIVQHGRVRGLLAYLGGSLMGSPKTRPTIGQRWPRNAEGQRRQIAESAQDARELLEDARDNLRPNPMLAQVQIADAIALLADIQRLSVEARIGVEPAEEEA